MLYSVDINRLQDDLDPSPIFRYDKVGMLKQFILLLFMMMMMGQLLSKKRKWSRVF